MVATVDGQAFEGATEAPGGRHAEIAALDAARGAGAEVRGAAVFVTLEPCAHTGRTGPCTDALVAAHVGRVAVAIEDPDPLVAGAGIAALHAAGIEVDLGTGAEVVVQDLAAYLTHRRLGRPFVTLKLAMTPDGRTTTGDPRNPWVTGPEARADGHRLRAENDAILVGAATVRADNPRLTTRDAPGPDPVRVVLGQAPSDAAVHPCLERSGPIEDIVRDLATDGVTSLLVEGGERVAQEFAAARLVDRYVFYVADAAPDDARRVVEAMWPAEAVESCKIGHDVRVTLVPRNRG